MDTEKELLELIRQINEAGREAPEKLPEKLSRAFEKYRSYPGLINKLGVHFYKTSNYGLAAAMGRWVLFTGDDIEPSPDLLEQHLAAHDSTPHDRWAVLGKISWPDDLELTSTMRHVDGVGAQQFSYHYMRDGEEYDYQDG